MEHLQRVWHTSRNAYPSGHLVPSLFGTCMTIVETIFFFKLAMIFPTFHLDYPSVLSRFCVKLFLKLPSPEELLHPRALFIILTGVSTLGEFGPNWVWRILSNLPDSSITGLQYPFIGDNGIAETFSCTYDDIICDYTVRTVGIETNWQRFQL